MKNKIIAISIALCLMAGSLIACSDSDKNSSSSSEATTTTQKEIIDTVDPSTPPYGNESGEYSGEETYEHDVFDDVELLDITEDEPYYVCPPAVVVPAPETMEFYAINYKDIIAQHESETGCAAKTHEVTFFDSAYDGTPEMFVWCKEGDGDVFMVYKNPDSEDFYIADLFKSKGEIDMFSEGTAIWLGGDCDGTCSRIFSVSHDYSEISETERDVTETVNVVEIALSFDETYKIEGVETSKYAMRTFHETLGDDGKWQASDLKYYVFYNDEGFCDEPQECDENQYYRPNPAQMVGFNKGIGSVLPEDAGDEEKIFNDFMATDAVTFPIEFG